MNVFLAVIFFSNCCNEVSNPLLPLASALKFFQKLDFVVNIGETAGRAFHIIEKPSPLAELDCIHDGFLQRPGAPPQFLQLVRRHLSWVIHVTDALPAEAS